MELTLNQAVMNVQMSGIRRFTGAPPARAP